MNTELLELILRTIRRVIRTSGSWLTWLLIPFIMELIPAVRSMWILRKRRKMFLKRNRDNKYLPEITLLIPVYNSKDTLYRCIQSIHESTYPNECINILLIDNKGSREDFEEYCKAQEDFPELRMQWIQSQAGKSKALNMALYNSTGKYIINVDSDGRFERTALYNMVCKFEEDPTLNCMTGAILTEPAEIDAYKGFGRLIRRLEYVEYAQAFLAGRSYAADNNDIYTLSGAFSAFRKSAVLSSQMYNTDTISEDTQLTFQMRYKQNDRIEICEDAIYIVGSIENMNKLYTQRQRWQRGSLEVGKMFSDNLSIWKMFSDVNVRTLMYDHTFAFPRLIWYLVILYFIINHYSAQILIITTGLMYLMYVWIGFRYYKTVKFFLQDIDEEREYYVKCKHYIWLLPIFNLLVFFIRFSGVINSIGTDSSWKTTTFTDEMHNVKDVMKEDFHIKKRKKDE